jgi:hypothetical protein
MKCIHCNLETTNPRFCSRSCSASYNNREHPKRDKQKTHCKHCGIEIRSRRTTCDRCNPSYVNWADVAIGDVKLKSTHQYSARIRQVARNVYRQSNKPKNCSICGYDKHIEVCHKRPIKDFPDSALVSDVNNMSNLVALCPNHHWEFDNGQITF